MKRYGGLADSESNHDEPLTAVPSHALRIAGNGCLIGAVEALNDVIAGDRSGLRDYQTMTRKARAIALELSKRHGGGQLHLFTRIEATRKPKAR